MLSTEAGTQEVHDMLAEIMISEKLLVAEWPQRDMGKFASLSWGKMNSDTHQHNLLSKGS